MGRRNNFRNTNTGGARHMENEQREIEGRVGSQEDEIFNAIQYNGTDRIVNFLEFYEFRKNQTKYVKNFSTGLGLLDSALDGLETGELNVISGPTGNGKTLFAESLSMRLMRLNKLNVLWFSFEVQPEKLIQKYLKLGDSKELGLFIPMELKTGNFEWLKRKCLEGQLKYNVSAVFIDHLHFLVDMNNKQNMSLNIGAVMRNIKHEIAKGMNLMVFIICHQGQPKEEEPSLENIRDSSFIGQESDNVFVVYRVPDSVPMELEKNALIKGYPKTYTNGQAIVKIEKARRAGTYRKKISFQKEGDWLEETL